jgi:lysozyme
MGLLNAVVDLSHHNAVTSFADARAAGVVGVIHKATQGTEFVDATFDRHRVAATAAGVLWGAYHFARSGEVEAQVEHFLSVANIQADELPVLDFEPNSRDGTMSLAEAEAFVTLMYERTGRYPGLYGGQSFLRETVGDRPNSPLGRCWLWIARYSSVAPIVPSAWKRFVLWQYTDGNAGMQPHQVPGIGRCDRDKYDGDEETLRRLWRGGSLFEKADTPIPPARKKSAGRRAGNRAKRGTQ